ncbi:MAG: GNAT family N-acetyltransferase [Gemmatimonadales bacterium]
MSGPHVATLDDVSQLKRVFSDAFTDRYRKDGLVGVRVPQLNPAIWRYALQDADRGAMIWRDEQNEVVAFNIVHRSGSEGWMGPLAVRTDRQGMGVGRVIVEAAIEWLREAGVLTIGLETMPRTVENIGFYSRLGFIPRHLTITMTGEATRRAVSGPVSELARLPKAERAELMRKCAERLSRSAHGRDFRREMELTDQLGIGDTVVIEREGVVSAFAVWHSAPLTRGRSADELRVLKLFADSVESFERLVVAVELCAGRANLRRVAIRCQTAYGSAYRALLERGYRVRWTDLRMTLVGYPEMELPEGEILFSNWEI